MRRGAAPVIVSAGIIGLACVLATSGTASAQQVDLSQGGPVAITARDGIDWRQTEQVIIAHGEARAVRGNVTVTADTLTAWYRKKAGADSEKPPSPQPASQGFAVTPGITGEPDAGGTEIYKLQALGNVHIFTPTDQVWGDRALYDIDQAVLVMTGRSLKLTTPTQVLTARDTLEYWSQKHMAVARGDAVALTNDARRIAADTLVAYTSASDTTPASGTKPEAKAAPASGGSDPLGASGKLQKVEAFGNVSIRTPTDIVTGDYGNYLPDTGLARVSGLVRITRGQNQLNGSEADVNMKTGIAHLVSGTGGRVQGLVIPNDPTNQSLATSPLAGGSPLSNANIKDRATGKTSP
jgi:lipopolysaccharide export system protein LptA